MNPVNWFFSRPLHEQTAMATTVALIVVVVWASWLAMATTKPKKKTTEQIVAPKRTARVMRAVELSTDGTPPAVTTKISATLNIGEKAHTGLTPKDGYQEIKLVRPRYETPHPTPSVANVWVRRIKASAAAIRVRLIPPPFPPEEDEE